MVCLLHVSATVVAILREVHCNGYITKKKHFEPLHKYKTLVFKMYVLKHKKQKKFCDNFKRVYII